jgi:hypothetical protein
MYIAGSQLEREVLCRAKCFVSILPAERVGDAPFEFERPGREAVLAR